MSCLWKEDQAHRFAEGCLEDGSRRVFADHLDNCPLCRSRVAEARRLDAILKAGIVPVTPPATLASRIASAAFADRNRGFRLAWPLPFGRPSFSPALAALATVLLLSVAALLAAPGGVMAVVQRALLFIPGLGISAVDEGHLVSTGPAVVRDGNVVFTVKALLSDGEMTLVEFEVTGLPGGKDGWSERGRQKPRTPFLRDEKGRQYKMLSGNQGVGGSPDENHINGGMTFEPLPGDLEKVELVMPVDYLVLPTVLPEAGEREWVAVILLSRPGQSGLPQATPQAAAATVKGITLRVAATSTRPDQTVVLLEGSVPDKARLIALGRPGEDPAKDVVLRDGTGNSFKLIPQNVARMTTEPFRQDLYFQPPATGSRQLSLEVAAVQLQQEGDAAITIRLDGLKVTKEQHPDIGASPVDPMGRQMPVPAPRIQPESTLQLDRTVTLGDYQVRLKSASLVEDRGQPWLYVDVDLGPMGDDGWLAYFGLTKVGSWMSSMGSGSGAQMDRFGLKIEPGAKEVTIHLTRPVVVVKGPWKLTFPVD
ncbi:MAG: anti-sigma factor family protein [Chloroflexota bacterium]|jgi:hypothetical protein